MGAARRIQVQANRIQVSQVPAIQVQTRDRPEFQIGCGHGSTPEATELNSIFHGELQHRPRPVAFQPGGEDASRSIDSRSRSTLSMSTNLCGWSAERAEMRESGSLTRRLAKAWSRFLPANSVARKTKSGAAPVSSCNAVNAAADLPTPTVPTTSVFTLDPLPCYNALAYWGLDGPFRRNSARTVRNSFATRLWGYGRGVSRSRYAARPYGCHQGPYRASFFHPGTEAALRTRG